MIRQFHGELYADNVANLLAISSEYHYFWYLFYITFRVTPSTSEIRIIAISTAIVTSGDDVVSIFGVCAPPLTP